ncbi:MAG TPA: response regulator [Methanoregulaceae archaeon]|nr:response regulator [Methanoregulaceae archaeon]
MYSVLYVDDEEPLLEIGKLFLEEKGEFSVDTSLSATDAFETIKRTRYDAIISDYLMPGLDGIEFLKQVRSVFGDIPFILFTGKGREEVVIQAIDNGVDFYLQKGGEPGAQYAELAHKIRTAVNKKRTEKAMRENEEKFRSLVSNALEAILIVDFQGSILFANNATADIVGVDDYRSLTGRNVIDFIAPESREDVIRDFSEVSKGHDGYLAHYSVITARGKKIQVESIGKVIGYEGNPADLISLRDLTDRKRTEDALTCANKKLNLLYSAARHDISNQLMVLDSFHILIQENIGNPDLVQEYLGKCSIASRNIRDQISFAKDLQNLGEKAPKWQNISHSINQAAKAFLMQDIGVLVDLPNTEVFADPLLYQVFFNLIDNSLRHGGIGLSEICVSGRETEDGLVIVYNDNGTGIPSGAKEQIFLKGYGKNTGIGLFLVREILAITGISIRETGNENEGARFEMTVPKESFRVNNKSLD